MAMGLKKIETRHWSTYYRGPLLIHAAKRRPTKAELEYIHDILNEWGYDAKSILSDLPLGALVCKVDLISCIKTRRGDNPGGIEQYLGDYTPGRFMWITDNLKAFDPIPYRGSQGFFEVPDDLLRHPPGC